MRHEGHAFDSFVPRRIEVWAEAAYEEGARGLTRVKWAPFEGIARK